jgi:uncharacterized protein (DUF2141 family)
MLKSVSIILLIWLLGNTPCPAVSEPGKTGDVVITITNLKNTKGHIGVRLYNKKEGFPSSDKNVFKQTLLKISDSRTATYVFQDLPYGDYALIAIHDENSNMDMDKNIFGYPKEGLCTSNNVRLKLGPPTFDQTKFTLNNTKSEIAIKMVYY